MSCSKKINNCSFLCESVLSLIFDKSLKDKCLPQGYIKALLTNSILSLVDGLFKSAPKAFNISIFNCDFGLISGGCTIESVLSFKASSFSFLLLDILFSFD